MFMARSIAEAGMRFLCVCAHSEAKTVASASR